MTDRVRPTISEKHDIWDKQEGDCAICGERLSARASDYHHKDGDRSNWRLSNIQLVCVGCHRKETNTQRIKKTHVARRRKKQKDKDPMGLGGLGILKPNRKSKSIFGGF